MDTFTIYWWTLELKRKIATKKIGHNLNFLLEVICVALLLASWSCHFQMDALYCIAWFSLHLGVIYVLYVGQNTISKLVWGCVTHFISAGLMQTQKLWHSDNRWDFISNFTYFPVLYLQTGCSKSSASALWLLRGSNWLPLWVVSVVS